MGCYFTKSYRVNNEYKTVGNFLGIYIPFALLCFPTYPVPLNSVITEYLLSK
jgi:hypothetical protein